MIPKTVHMSWKDKSILESTNPLVVEGVKRVIELNPNWEVTIYDDAEVDAYLKEQLEPQHYELIQDKHIVQKTDLWRLVKLFIEGGVYMDIDGYRIVKFNRSSIVNPNNNPNHKETKWKGIDLKSIYKRIR